ncbi:Hypothetical_protein [Hexamita inflata]|uniref:Hypothetical_protein n=1 Tax=Hexamita inflata TaxID=28002 RepID=A0AA86PEK9_9EUKA|nr:Hypothetical protein HINF_LOCUS24747 [Hexamita inflata]
MAILVGFSDDKFDFILNSRRIQNLVIFGHFDSLRDSDFNSLQLRYSIKTHIYSGIEAAAVLQRVRCAVQWRVFALKCSHVARRVRGLGLRHHKSSSPPFWDLSSGSGVCSIWAEKTASERTKALEWGIPNGGICAQLLRSESNREDSGATDVFVELSDSELNEDAKEREPEAVSCWMLKMHSKAALNQFNDE